MASRFDFTDRRREMRIATISLATIALGVMAASPALGKNSQKIYNIDLTQVAQVPANTWSAPICATSPNLFVNVNHLRWMLRRTDSHLKLMPGTPANCRRYYAPAKVYGWDRITVTFRYHGNIYVGQTQFYVTYPQRP